MDKSSKCSSEKCVVPNKCAVPNANKCATPNSDSGKSSLPNSSSKCTTKTNDENKKKGKSK